MLAKPGKIRCKPIQTPMNPNHKLCRVEEEQTLDKKIYQILVEKLIYLVHT